MPVSFAAQVHTIRLVSHDPLQATFDEFLLSREARGLSQRTVAWYGEQLRPFVRFLQGRGVADAAEITPSLLRAYLLERAQGHNPGGVHGAYRAARHPAAS